MGVNFDKYFQSVLEINDTYDEKYIIDNKYYFEDCFRHDLSIEDALQYFESYLEEIKGEITNDEFREFNNIQQRYAFLYRRIENRITRMLEKIHPEQDFIVDDIIFNADEIEVNWSKFEPYENTTYFPNEWLFDNDWYKKYREMELEKMEVEIQELEEKEKQRKIFFE